MKEPHTRAAHPVPGGLLSGRGFVPPIKPLTGPRVFCIGFNKTGTTTMGRCFEALGLNPIAEPRSPYIDYVALARFIFQHGDYEPALQAASYFRSFQDRPWNVWEMYKRLDQRFEGSRFVLTERSTESWWNSVERWLLVSNQNDGAKLQRYLDHLRLRNLTKAGFIAAYEKYNEEAKAYFTGRSDLLVMNLEKGDAWQKLCAFLRLPAPNLAFPHANRQKAALLK
jgi:hypothetical protein